MDTYSFGKIECKCGEKERIELIDKKEVETEKRGIGFNVIRVVPIFNYIFLCKNCGELFLVQIDPDEGKK
ncbi:MAG: hypothetical protein A4E27_00522 [Methanobacterium sp. PtaU1.Bin242]|nr:MAG: hypothetical protein A4E27_00522 [Methanobacterium sp. PtaU1.Bin242]